MDFKTKLILGIALIQIVLSSFLIAYNINILRNTNQSEIARRARTTIELFSSVSRDAILSTDVATLQVLANDLMKQPSLRYVEVRDSSGRILVLKGSILDRELDKKQDVDIQSVDDGIFDLQKEIIEAGTKLATIYIGMDVSFLSKAILDARRQSQVIALAGIVLVGIFSYFLGIFLSRQLIKLREGARRVTSGELDLQVQVVGKDELADTARAFNEMLKKLHANHVVQDAIMQASMDAIITTDVNGDIQFINDAAEILFKVNREEFLGKSLFQLFTQDTGKSESPHIKDLLAEKPSKPEKRSEMVLVSRNGKKIPVELVVMFINEVGADPFYTLYISDITDRKQAEVLKSDFVSTVSHELRTPLTAIYGALSFMVSGALEGSPDKQKQIVDVAYSNSMRLLQLVNDLLDIQKIDSGKMELALRDLNVKQILQDSIDENMAYAEKYRVQLELADRSDSEPRVLLDQGRFMQIMANLISNAVKFSHEQGMVTVLLETPDSRVKISVIDHGEGIPQEYLEHIFEKFTQAHAGANRKHRGTGLGMSIIKHLVDIQNGNIEIHSVVDKGTTVSVSFPRVLQ